MRILVLPGDGIGPEIVDAALIVLEKASHAFDLHLSFDHDDVGFVSLAKHGTTLRDEVLQKAKTYDGVILGPQSHADYPAPEQGGAQCLRRFSHWPGSLRQCAPGTHAPLPGVEHEGRQEHGSGDHARSH